MVYIVYVHPAVLESSEMKTSRNKQDDNGLDAVLPIMASGSVCCKEISALPPHALVCESPIVNVEASTGAFARGKESSILPCRPQ